MIVIEITKISTLIHGFLSLLLRSLKSKMKNSIFDVVVELCKIKVNIIAITTLSENH